MRTNLSSQFDPATIKRTGARIIQRNTFERFEDGARVIRLHATDIVRIDPATRKRHARVTLNSGGYRTMTTRGRMNDYLGSNYVVTSGDGFWYVRDRNTGESVPYFDGIVLPDAFLNTAVNKRAWREHEREKVLKDSIKRAVARMPKTGHVPYDEPIQEPEHANKYFGYSTSGARGVANNRLLHVVRSGRIPGSVVRDAITWSGRNPQYFAYYGSLTSQMVRRYLGAKLGLVVR